jgi:hypothetical protein
LAMKPNYNNAFIRTLSKFHARARAVVDLLPRNLFTTRFYVSDRNSG